MWTDSSVRMTSNNMTSHFNHVMRSGGALLYRGTYLSNVQATSPQLFEYFPTDRARQRETVLFPATAMFFVLTRHNFENIIYWFVLWALEKPRNERSLFGNCKPRVKSVSSCHRFDESCINVLLSNLHSFNQTLYTFIGPDLPLKFVRGDAGMARDCSRVLTGTVANDTRARVAEKRDKILKQKIADIEKQESQILQYL